MSDPAVEAVGRACVYTGTMGDLPIAAVREALKPLRQLHYPIDGQGQYPVCVTCCTTEGGPLVAGSPIEWPCATARLVYPESELS